MYIMNIHGAHSYWKQGHRRHKGWVQPGRSIRHTAGRDKLCRHTHSMLYVSLDKQLTTVTIDQMMRYFGEGCKTKSKLHNTNRVAA